MIAITRIRNIEMVLQTAFGDLVGNDGDDDDDDNVVFMLLVLINMIDGIPRSCTVYNIRYNRGGI